MLRRGLSSSSWLGPLSAFAIANLALSPVGVPFGGTVAIGAVCVCIISAWLGLSAVNTEDPGHQSVLASLSGGRFRLRFSQLSAAMAVALGLGVVVIGIAALRSVNFPSSVDLAIRLGVSGAGIVTSAVVGIALAYCCAWPVLQRPPISLAAGVVLSVCAIGAPGSPLRFVLISLGEVDVVSPDLRFVQMCIATVALSVVGCTVMTPLVKRRWGLSRD